MDKDFNKVFELCPSCGSPSRFLETLSQELKDRGLARPEWNLRLDVRDGVVLDDNKVALMPIGIKIPGYHIETDVCMDCGTVYAVRIARIEGETRATKQQPKGFPPDWNKLRAN